MSQINLNDLKKALQKAHPDKGGDTATFQKLLVEYKKAKQQKNKNCDQCVRGFVTERYGAFVRKYLCPKCWGT